jgi:MoaA/NifB/PqqE/SkfB family radical SAM enzyme
MNFGKAARIARLSLTPAKPYHAQWKITGRCNSRCRGCRVWGERDERTLPTAEVKAGLDVLARLGVVNLVLTGGNPLLRDDIEEIIAFASRRFITTVYDNGSLAADRIEALRPADFVAISIDSLDPAKNDELRGVPGSTRAALDAIEALRSAGIEVIAAPMISRANVEEIPAMTRHFLAQGVCVTYSLYAVDPSEPGEAMFGIGRESDELAIADGSSMVRLCDELLRLKQSSGRLLVTTRILSTLKTLFSEGRRTWTCRALRSFLVIDPVGNVAGCHLKPACGRLDDLFRLWRSARFAGLRDEHRACKQCSYLCYLSFSLHGTVAGNIGIAADGWRSAPLFLKRGRDF